MSEELGSWIHVVDLGSDKGSTIVVPVSDLHPMDIGVIRDALLSARLFLQPQSAQLALGAKISDALAELPPEPKKDPLESEEFSRLFGPVTRVDPPMHFPLLHPIPPRWWQLFKLWRYWRRPWEFIPWQIERKFVSREEIEERFPHPKNSGYDIGGDCALENKTP